MQRKPTQKAPKETIVTNIEPQGAKKKGPAKGVGPQNRQGFSDDEANQEQNEG